MYDEWCTVVLVRTVKSVLDHEGVLEVTESDGSRWELGRFFRSGRPTK